MTENNKIMAKITKNMKIDEIIRKTPKTEEILLKEGIHCVGCMTSHFESLEEGLKSHGKTKKQIEEIIEKINKSKL